jgi:hypothetical protein
MHTYISFVQYSHSIRLRYTQLDVALLSSYTYIISLILLTIAIIACRRRNRNHKLARSLLLLILLAWLRALEEELFEDYFVLRSNYWRQQTWLYALSSATYSNQLKSDNPTSIRKNCSKIISFWGVTTEGNKLGYMLFHLLLTRINWNLTTRRV